MLLLKVTGVIVMTKQVLFRFPSNKAVQFPRKNKLMMLVVAIPMFMVKFFVISVTLVSLTGGFFHIIEVIFYEEPIKENFACVCTPDTYGNYNSNRPDTTTSTTSNTIQVVRDPVEKIDQTMWWSNSGN